MFFPRHEASALTTRPHVRCCISNNEKKTSHEQTYLLANVKQSEHYIAFNTFRGIVHLAFF